MDGFVNALSSGPESSALRAFQEKLGYFFRDGGLLATALRHASYAHENGLADSNERLEFLGDSVLGMVVAHVLYETCPDAPEGELSRRRVEFVCRGALARWAEGLNLARVLMKGKSLKNSVSPSVCADAMEAVVGAVYLDGGFDAAARVIRRYLFGSEALPNGGVPDAKSRLQALLQAGEEGLPRYEVLSVTGPSHSPLFRVRVRAGERAWEGEGPGRKAAELEAAARALSDLLPKENAGPEPGGLPS
ncbi:MAG: ribonuclease III [Synergistaceae bacterium]|jgi:ribonuclease III|nr:ribonuclease III [Synergistaceae bacterium]